RRAAAGAVARPRDPRHLPLHGVLVPGRRRRPRGRLARGGRHRRDPHGPVVGPAGDAARPPVPGPLPEHLLALMLERLVVANLVVIRDADVQFGPGLNVLTGETGAGKTIITGALDLALGGKAESSLVGPNA